MHSKIFIDHLGMKQKSVKLPFKEKALKIEYLYKEI